MSEALNELKKLSCIYHVVDLPDYGKVYRQDHLATQYTREVLGHEMAEGTMLTFEVCGDVVSLVMYDHFMEEVKNYQLFLYELVDLANVNGMDVLLSNIGDGIVCSKAMTERLRLIHNFI